MAIEPSIRLPRQWPAHVKSGILHAISLAAVVLAHAQGGVTGRSRLQAEVERAKAEIALLREELALKDGRWERAHSRRRPHYTPRQRMRILQLRAARGWTLETTARVFLVDLLTLRTWMRRLVERGERELIQTVEPVNRYPDFVRNLVRQLKRLFPSMGSRRIAQLLAKAGLRLGATTIRRMIHERKATPDPEPDAGHKSRRRIVARDPGQVWHVDLTAVPTRAGFWVPWLPLSLPQRWPFCWWVAVAVDQLSRAVAGFAVFPQPPTSEQVQGFLDRAIRANGTTPGYIVTDKGSQFWCGGFKRWCRRRGIRPRYGAVGQPASIAVVERFILSLKQECTRVVMVPLSLPAMRRELRLYMAWYNGYRPHTALVGKTPHEVHDGLKASRRRIEPRPNWPHRGRLRAGQGDRVTIDVGFLEKRKHLPVIALRRAA